MSDVAVQDKTSQLSERLQIIAREMQDIGAGRRVPAAMWSYDHGCTYGKHCIFMPLKPEEGRDARYFRMEGEKDGTIYFRPKLGNLEELYFRDQISPSITTKSQFVPVNQGPITVGVRPRSDVWFWSGRDAQKAVDSYVQHREWVLEESVKGPYARPVDVGPVTRAANKLFAPLTALLKRIKAPKVGME